MAHFALMWPGDVAPYKAVCISPWPWKCSVEELVPDVLHKGLFVVATSAAYDRMS